MTSPAKQCLVFHHEGTLYQGQAVTNVEIVCTPTFGNLVGYILSGLQSELVVNLNGDLSIPLNTNSDGELLGEPLEIGSSYTLTVEAQPADQECTVHNGQGLIAGPLTEVVIHCEEPTGSGPTGTTVTCTLVGDATGTATNALADLEVKCTYATVPACGDGIVQSNEDEECDDGGTVSGDGCSATCQHEITMQSAYVKASNATGIDGDESNNSAAYAGAMYVFE